MRTELLIKNWHGWDIAYPKHPPEILRIDIIMILEGTDTIYKRSLASIIDVQNATSSYLDHFGHHIHSYKAIWTYFYAISYLRLFNQLDKFFMKLFIRIG